MTSKAIFCLVAALGFGAGSLSFAQGSDRQGVDERCNPLRGPAGNAPECYYYGGARGPEWRRGAPMPREYQNPQYIVNDWRAHRLNRPPRGSQWVQVGSNYVLVDRAGRIVQILPSQ